MKTMSEHLPFDSIRVPLSWSIEQDYQARDVFHTLRRSAKAKVMGQTEVHWCSPELVTRILSDAAERRQIVKGPLLAAYGRLVAVIEEDMVAASDRFKWLSSVEPKFHMDWHERKEYLAIPAQFAKLEVPLSLTLPGDAGGPSKRASYKDSRGRTCTITRAFSEFPIAYRVNVYLTKGELEAWRQEMLAKAAEKRAKPSFETANAYREHAATCLATVASIGMPQREANSPYSFDQGTLDAVAQKIKEAEYMLRSAKIVCTPSPDKAPASGAGREKPCLRLIHSSPERTV